MTSAETAVPRPQRAPALLDAAAVAPPMIRGSRTGVMAVLGLCGAALAIRLVTLLLTIDITGDGPTRATQAYAWSKSPYFATHGVWLPGFTYWAGAATVVVHDPLLGPRLLNVMLGTLTVPLFYALVRRLHGRDAAWLSAAILVVLPLHVGLSVSSLTEPSFLFFMVAALVALMWIFDGDSRSTVRVGVFLVCFVFAEMTRYEAWLLMPLVVAYFFWRDRRVSTTVVVTVALLLFPLGWSVGNYLAHGNPLYGLLLGVQPLEGGHPVAVWPAILEVGRQSARHLGWLLPVAALWGILVGLARMLRGTLNTEQTFYALLVCALWASNLRIAQALGPALYDRYLLFGYVIALPFACAGLLDSLRRYRHGMLLSVLVALGSVGVAYAVYAPQTFVTRTQPTDIVQLARWLPNSPYRDAAVVLTKMDWQSSYLPLYRPQLAGRSFIVSVWVNDDALEHFIREQKPALLITSTDDAAYRERVERILGHAIRVDAPAQVFGALQVYDLTPRTAGDGRTSGTPE